jgi:ADP-ribose pyrophosphatase YjhB (NUDIX family)
VTHSTATTAIETGRARLTVATSSFDQSRQYDIDMKFCSQCGHPVVVKIPDGDNVPRHICESCATIHYQNPKMIVGCLPYWKDQVLLCKRAIQPRVGLWTLPAGYLENGETTLQGAIRETLEEAGARVQVDDFYSLINLPHIDQVYLFFRARLLDLDFVPGTESLEVSLFQETEIPWDHLAFRTVSMVLKDYFSDRQQGEFKIRVQDLTFKRSPD